MSVFKYKAKSKEGKIKNGTVVAASKGEAGNQLRNEGLSPLFVKDTSSGKRSSLFSSPNMPLIEKTNMCRYLGTMIKAGLPIAEALEVISSESNHPVTQKILVEAQASINRGQLLSTAFANFPRIFDETFITLIKAGEESGTLETAFESLANQLYADYELSSKVKSTLAYPAVVTSATLGLGIAMLVFVVPKIAPVLLRLSKDFPLPAYTVMILKIGAFLSDNLLFFLLGLAGLGVGLGIFLFSYQGKKILTAFLSRLPLVKDLYEQMALARFNRTLATLLRTGVPIINALQVSTGTLNLPRYKGLKKNFADEVSHGHSFSDVLKNSQAFPPIMINMVVTGEKTATLDKLLLDLADFYAEKISNSLKSITSMIEPILMLLIGLGAGFIVISLIAPIYSFVGSLSQTIGG